MQKSTNLLGEETSPYLLQHRDNPVHWHAWNDTSLAEAKDLNKPILLSIGYAACHWCHVMAHESFEDQETADVMNRLFVNIKVDREERPDVDAIYMAALHQLGEQGGWPLTMFLTPEAAPFWGGTYFPKEPNYGRPGFIQVMTGIARIFHEEPEKVAQNHRAVRERLDQQNAAKSPAKIDNDFFLQTGEKILSIWDPVNGGVRGAPKFPQTNMIETLWRCGQQTGNQKFNNQALFALERMAFGGIYDHLAGGFSRYTVDERWLIPHFEKMLYDNALILNQMINLWPETKSPILEKTIAETIHWLKRDMQIDDGGLASSYDADSEGEEGRFYVWSRAEIGHILGEEDGAFFARHYDITTGGNWEGKSIPNRLDATILEDKKTEDRLRNLRARLLEERRKRVWPGLDDKILADWNGLAVTAICRASRMFNQNDWLEFAKQIFHFVSESMSKNGVFVHSTRAGKTTGQGMLADYANMIEAALELYQTTLEEKYIVLAKDWADTVLRLFPTKDDGFFMTPETSKDLILRPRNGADDATPNGNPTMMRNFIVLGAITGNINYDTSARKILTAFSGDIKENPLAHVGLLNAFDQANRQIQVLVNNDGVNKKSVGKIISDAKFPYPIVLYNKSIPETMRENIAAEAVSTNPDGIYVCIPGTCLPPALNEKELVQRLDEAGTMISN